MTLLLMLLFKSFLVFALSGAALLCLRRASASARHLVCLLTLAALLALPLFSLTLPGWHIAALQEEPAPQQHWLSGGQAATLPKREGAEFRPAEAPQFAPPSNNTTSGTSAVSSETPRLPASGGQALVPSGFLAFYLLGLLLASARPLLGLWGIAHLRRACVPISDPLTLDVSADCAAALRLSRLPLLCRADVPVPMTWGWIRPVVLLPLGSVGWPEDRLRSVLLHEMAHIKRRDWPCHRLADLTCAVYWFHPLVWLTARRLRAESEIACDDLVLSSGIAAPEYARHLLDIAGALPPSSRRSPLPAAITMAQTPHIQRRILMVLDKTHSRRTVTRRALLVALIPTAAAVIMLAVLRPDAKAQAAPVSVPLSPASQHLMFTLHHGSVIYNGHGRQTLVTTPDMTINGTRLLAGITDAGKPGSSWWSATGALLPAPVYDTNAYHSDDHVGDSSTHNVSFAFRLPPTASGITTDYKLEDSKGSSGDGDWPGKSQSDGGHTESQMFAATGGTRVVTSAFPAALKKTSIQIGIAAGPWRTAASNHNPSSGLSTNDGAQGFILGAAEQTAKSLALTVTTNSTDDLRIIAVDRQGNELLPDDHLGSGINGMDQITVHFSQPLSQIKEFRVETRPFQWIEFKNVALQPVK